jgi:hypothetical protein
LCDLLRMITPGHLHRAQLPVAPRHRSPDGVTALSRRTAVNAVLNEAFREAEAVLLSRLGDGHRPRGAPTLTHAPRLVAAAILAC